MRIKLKQKQEFSDMCTSLRSQGVKKTDEEFFDLMMISLKRQYAKCQFCKNPTCSSRFPSKKEDCDNFKA